MVAPHPRSVAPGSIGLGAAVCGTIGRVPIHALTPYAHVADIHRSIAFYGHLGLTVRNSHRDDGTLAWALLTSPSPDRRLAGARLMLAAADRPVVPSEQAVLFYCWTDDIHAVHARLEAAGADVGPIARPSHMAAGELRTVDPDGYVVLVGQPGEI